MSRSRQVWRAWFQPPRPHGQLDELRNVSFVELFFDLVFVLLVGRLAHALGHHISWHAVWGYAVLFTIVWFAWLNGTLYHEYHGRPDGRSRMYIFAQMALLVLLAVFAEEAATVARDGRWFAIILTVLLVLLMYQWSAVMPHDAPEFRPLTVRYVTNMGIATLVSFASIFVATPEVRLWLWTGGVIFAIITTWLQIASRNEAALEATRVTHAFSERFGLYVILVLGEVVLGAVNGMEVGRGHNVAIATGMIGLAIGYGIWWTYFDFIGLRRPNKNSGAHARWIFFHLPLSAAIAAAGAAMTQLIEAAVEGETPVKVGWLLAGSVAVVLLSEAAILTTLPPRPGLERVQPWLIGGAIATALIGFWDPTPWLFGVLILIPLSAVWWQALFASADQGYLVNGEPLDNTVAEAS